MSRLEPDIAKQRAIKDQLADYRASRRRFARANALPDRFTTDPCVWWEDYGADTSELHTLAMKILNQAISSSCLEQLWSTFSHVASKKRNQLDVVKTNDLIFVSANLRLLERYENLDTWKHWLEEDEKGSESEKPPTLLVEMIASSSGVVNCKSADYLDYDYMGLNNGHHL